MRSSVIVFSALLLTTTAASAATIATIRDFCSVTGCTDGKGGQNGSLVMDASGVLYGTAVHGGTTDYGVVFSLTPNANKTSWTYSVLHNFASEAHHRDGGSPTGTLVLGTDGSLYGVAEQFGGDGVIYKLTPNKKHTVWKETVLHKFCEQRNCKDGFDPRAGLTYRGAASGQLYDGVSPLYGPAMGGQHRDGLVYELSFVNGAPSYKIIHNFCSRHDCADGINPNTTLAFDAAGNLYGTTEMGGAVKGGDGVIFELKPLDDGTWQDKVLYDFCSQANCTSGADAETGVVVDRKGNIYGATEAGGTNGHGLLYELKRDGTLVVLHEFCGDDICSDGNAPHGDLLVGPDGALTGVTVAGGYSDLNKGGVIYRFDGSGFSVLHTFCSEANCGDGDFAQGGVTADSAGNLYGTTSAGGANSEGTVYQLKP